MADFATINVKRTTKIVIARIAKKYNMSIVDFVESIGNYFDVTGVNPADQVVLSPAEELKKFRDTIISFMRKQEKDYILPVFGQMEILIARFMEYIENEAPRKDGIQGQLFSTNNPKIENMEEVKTPQMKTPILNVQVNNLEMDLEMERQKVRNMKIAMNNIFDHSEYKSTGLTKRIVIDLPKGEFDNIKQMIKLL